MRARFFEGAAGTGKTTRLMAELEAVLLAAPLARHQSVLALSKMHGSRRRLSSRLGRVAALGGRFNCMTIDSFAHRLVRRWRGLCRARFGDVPPASFEEQCSRAGAILQLPFVSQWVAATFPVVLADEIQDSKGGQIEILKGLASHSELLLAGDEFQDLDAAATGGAVAWARSLGPPEHLSQIHRTAVQGLLDAAKGLRAGQPIAGGAGFELVGVPSWALGAGVAARFIARGKKGETVVLISPVSGPKSAFVRQLVDRLGAAPLGKLKNLGPYRLPWERNEADQVDEVMGSLGLAGRPGSDRVAANQFTPGVQGPERALSRWLDGRRKRTSAVEFTVDELRDAVTRIVQNRRSHSGGSRTFASMTVHQAKNQEFDNVIVLWPYEAGGAAEKARRLLYNAVTRAKRRAVVIVQNNVAKKDRLKAAPFV